ncbi:hypothetical protein [Mycobacteroides abscessus]|uniref:hypothetical protein n=1 Tax=Mycobacteroides abscessus TaxID=36809 RepID=UPI0009A78FB9|nr:hypothetical protein [Mycobacteroides abscessus]SKO14850.1 Uncharacterised protein [Mycobacteroides abscessus subsp. bolletii]SKX37578.1 Uncharacterised protein [Mycobacteroides abscessus subsp. bolletii]
MSEPAPAGSKRIPPRDPGTKIKDLTILVQVPHNRDQTRAFTDEQADAAAEHAAKYGGSIEPLPVPNPAWDWETHSWTGA